MGDMRALTTKVTSHILMVLAGPDLPSLVPLASTAPADKHMLARHTPHKLNGSHKARNRIMFS
jgi:hypothetical protein